MSHRGYIPQYFVPPPAVDDWMDGEWDGYDRDASERAALEMLREELASRYPDISFVTDSRAHAPTYQGLTWVGGDVTSAIERLTGDSTGEQFDDAYHAVMERYEEWIVPREEES